MIALPPLTGPGTIHIQAVVTDRAGNDGWSAVATVEVFTTTLPWANIDTITTSDIRITCVIGEAAVPEAVRALHAAFELDEG